MLLEGGGFLWRRSRGDLSRGCGPDAGRGKAAEARWGEGIKCFNRRIRDDAPYLGFELQATNLSIGSDAAYLGRGG
jgi:hypothetical protein